MLYMNYACRDYVPASIEGKKDEYIKRTAELLEHMDNGDYLTAFDSYGRMVTIHRHASGFESYTNIDIISKRTAPKETARRLYELDINNRIGY